MAAYRRGFMTHVTCRLTAKNRDQLRNPTLGNRLWATFLLPNDEKNKKKNNNNTKCDPSNRLRIRRG